MACKNCGHKEFYTVGGIKYCSYCGEVVE